MKPSEARYNGGRKALKIAFFIFLILELIGLIIETRGDFANGILFFISGQLKPIVVIYFGLFCGITFMFGRRAGVEITIGQKPAVRIAIKYAILSSLILCVYLGIASAIVGKFEEAISNGVQMVFGIFVVMLVTWLWSAYQIKGAGR